MRTTQHRAADVATWQAFDPFILHWFGSLIFSKGLYQTFPVAVDWWPLRAQQ